MTNKTEAAGAVSELLQTVLNEHSVVPQGDYRPQPVPAQSYLYFTETDTDRILDNLDGLRDMVFPPSIHFEEPENRSDQQFPSVCLIGLGRCGSNIALDVAELVYNARTFYLNQLNNDDRLRDDKGYSPARWIRNNLRLVQNKSSKPVFLVEPLVMLGDLDKDIAGRIRFLAQGREKRLHQGLHQDEDHGPVGGPCRWRRQRADPRPVSGQDHPQQGHRAFFQRRLETDPLLPDRFLRHQGQPVAPVLSTSSVRVAARARAWPRNSAWLSSSRT
jgi:hypothetical protein